MTQRGTTRNIMKRVYVRYCRETSRRFGLQAYVPHINAGSVSKGISREPNWT